MKFVDLLDVLDSDVKLDIIVDVFSDDNSTQSYEFSILCGDVYCSRLFQFVTFQVNCVYPSLIKKHSFDYIIEFHNCLKVFLTVPHAVWMGVDLYD